MSLTCSEHIARPSLFGMTIGYQIIGLLLISDVLITLFSKSLPPGAC